MNESFLYNHLIRPIGLLLAGALAFGPATAEDIDLYAGVGGAGVPANVLIILDNSSNWSSDKQNWPTDTAPPVACGNDCNKQGYYELKAIRTVVNNLPTTTSLNLGLMLFNKSNASHGGRDGGYVRYHVRPLNATNKADFLATLDNIIQNFNTETAAASVQYGAILFDAFKYFGGYTNPASNTAAPPANPTYGSIPVFGPQFWGTIANDPKDAAAYSGADYVPVSPLTCGRNFIIFVGNGFPAKKDNTTPDMGEVLRKLINPANPPTSITEFPWTTVTPNWSGWSNHSNCYNTQALCDADRPANTATTEYQCVKADCSGNNRKIQIRTVTSYTTTNAAPSGDEVARYADEFADFLYKTDVNSQTGQQNITLYAVDVYKDQQDANQTSLLRNMAKYGGGKYLVARNESELNQAFDTAFSEILSINSAFASASLSVSVNTQGTYRNQVFIGMFRPDPQRNPRWAGNLKHYQFILDTSNTLQLGDKNGNPAISASTGFVTPCSVSYWTPDTQDTYWSIQPQGACTLTGSAASNTPDGEVVEKGGAAYKLRALTPDSRNVKTCADSVCTGGLINFDTAATGTGLDSDLINWTRGKNVDQEAVDDSVATDPNIGTVMRPSAHGDVLHSRPLAIDFGTAGVPDVKVFYGGNDGMLRAIDADQANSEGGEMWSFVAPEHWGKLERLRKNSPSVRFPQQLTVSPWYEYTIGEPKDYFFDGPIGHYRSGSTVWIYPTMRRGGRALYAFDVSSPASPTLKWRRGCPNQSDDTGCTGIGDTVGGISQDLSGIGQTWAEPRVALVNGYLDGLGQPKPVLIMGGGYDPCEDNEPATCSSPKGARILVFDADTGTVLNNLALPTGGRSVVADVALVDMNFDGKVDMAYAADTGGNLYRIQIGSAAPSAWTVTKIASLGCDGNNVANCPNYSGPLRRKFLHAPEVVVTNDFNAILVGSGDREHPLNIPNSPINLARHVDNAFFMIKDKPSDSTWLDHPTSGAGSCNGENVICTASLYGPIDPASSTVPTATDLAAKKGWYLAFGSGSHDMEQVVTSSVVVGGYVYFSTHRPVSSSSTACSSNLGTSRAYAVNFLNALPMSGESRFDEFAGGGLPPSPVAGLVEVNSPTGGTVVVPFIIGGKDDGAGNTTTSPMQGQLPNIPITLKRTRVYWFLEKQ